ncbi:8-oxo-dGTP pyrophosphatase MutT (NUDIX family) [Alkalibacillus filiformis]|uniref:8-oxo-dGTP pyrophosphatase MutT (NUDIX family) n=1 Tax=Alkalibacillus filiformis TaxID=200990 RepID=A0ABU0DSR2_9BACI|nr:CoA pyrophosphatase [Alkalibacillus filiformis]MDQ0351472.1 8-oxo-dGTP pyrophosphatase MutT (NUDIX family) [Alkalibacillus filiformis]
MDYKALNKIIENHQSETLGIPDNRKYAIIIPLIEKDGELQIVFEVRSKNMRRQPGEICFPGGKVDEDDLSTSETAVRELNEELGVQEEQVNDVEYLGLLVTPFRLSVSAYTGFITLDSEKDFQPNPFEVDSIFTVPLSFFLNNRPEIHYINVDIKPDQDFPYNNIPNGKTYELQKVQYEEHFYYFKDYVIWGLTARILNDFIAIIKGDRN